MLYLAFLGLLCINHISATACNYASYELCVGNSCLWEDSALCWSPDANGLDCCYPRPPTTENPTTENPTTATPTTATPTTASPTTASPTTASPTSASPTTASPTSASPTSASPTSASPTSASPTSASPTSASPTSASPTSSSPTTGSPTTPSPTTADPTLAALSTAWPTAADTTPLVTSSRHVCPNQNRECNKPGECCSKWGFCGTTRAYCDNPYDFPDDSPDGCPDCPACDGNNTRAPQTTFSGTGEPETTEIEVPVVVFEEHCNCIIYGDPHTKMWNCAVNNWQGPHGPDAPGNVYYMTRCHDVEHINVMPFDLIGVIKRYDNYFTSLDSVKLRLWDGNDAGTEGEEYCIRNKGNDGVSYNTDCGETYTHFPAQNTVVTLGPFRIRWRFENGYSILALNVIDSECTNDLLITSQTVFAGNIDEEAVEIRVSDCYKAHTCGMCGNFYNTGLTFEKRDGSTMELEPGCWGGTANDETALTYFVDMEPRRRLAAADEIGEPCFGLISDIELECHAQLRQWADCCWDRSKFCEEMVLSCSWDSCACVMGQGVGFNTSECVYATLNATMSFVCGLGADSFAEPDMSVYDTPGVGGDGDGDGDDEEVSAVDCKEVEIVRYIILGVGISAAVFLVIGCFLYCFVFKPKLGRIHFKAQVNDTRFDRVIEGNHALEI